MRLNWRLSLLMILLTLLPALSAGWVTRQLIEQGLDLGLNPQIDGALDAGVRRAREHLAIQREILNRDLQDWVAQRNDGLTNSTDLHERWADWQGPVLSPEDRLMLVADTGERIILHEGEAIAQPSETAIREGAPPCSIDATAPLCAGWRAVARRPVASGWRDDAEILAGTLQVIRGLQIERRELERGFWLPFLCIYGLALLIGLIVATRLGHGITRPVQRLLTATKAIAAGRWDIEVPVTSGDEIGRLSSRFNKMVSTLDAQNRRLVDLEKMAGWREMARALAHEVKNPLTPIQLTVEEMHERYHGDDPEYQKLLDECSRIVVQEVASLRNVVERFREFSRPVEPRMRSVDINNLLTDVGALQKDLKVKLDLDPQLTTLEADEDRLRQMLMNLSQNARSATREVDQPQLRLVSELVDNKAVLRVEDNGPGIPATDREAVFEPYRSGTAGGLGLGLALVKGIILAHQGTIVAEEGQLGGACLRVELPLQQNRKNRGETDDHTAGSPEGNDE